MKIFDVEQGSEQWHACRSGLATASCFAAILSKGKDGAEAVGRKNLRARLVVERLTGKALDDGNGFKSKAMAQGNEREATGLATYELAKNVWLERVGFCRHEDIECGASPDALVGTDGGVELKCPEVATHFEYLDRKDEPPAYKAQIFGNLWVTGRDYWDFVSFNPDFPPALQLAVRRVDGTTKEARAYIAQLEFMVRAFMDEVKRDEATWRARG